MAEKYPGWSPYNYTLQNPVNFTDPTGMVVEGSDHEYEAVWNEEEQKYETNKISGLGGDKYDVTHYKGGSLDGRTELTAGCYSQFISLGADVIKGFNHRNEDVNWKKIYDEFVNGNGPKRSLMDDNHPMTEDMKMSYAAYKARAMYLKRAEKGYTPVNFGLGGIVRSGLNMTEQMVGSAGASIYPLGDQVIILLTDTKTPQSLFYHLPGLKPMHNRDHNRTNRLMPYSETKQSYIWIESVNSLKQNHYIYDTRFDTDW
ncbi:MULTISPECIES: hypothetical protein [Mesonia]|uniref:Uncharacterized protein n=1 Tax=Mesonia oceanica TaxID=2687242 RepID=A0AC61Y4Q7_9FLAO|nr:MULTISPECIES: hypothetical protein [Mesonia]VVU99037.1 hypothetical protein FVB9532_00287 [Mesonia oceanica]